MSSLDKKEGPREAHFHKVSFLPLVSIPSFSRSCLISSMVDFFFGREGPAGGTVSSLTTSW